MIKLIAILLLSTVTAVEAGGISANVPITTDNLQAVMVRKGTNGEYTVYIQVK